MMFLTNPMVNMSLVVGDGSSQEGVQFSPPLEQTKEIMINCLKEIVENTQNFPRIEVEIFPEYKDEEIEELRNEVVELQKAKASS